MPQFSGYSSRFGGAPPGAARDPSTGGYPSRSSNKGRPAPQPAPVQPMPPPQYPSPIQGPPAQPTPGDPFRGGVPPPTGNPGIEPPWMRPTPIQGVDPGFNIEPPPVQMPYDPGSQPWGPGQEPPPEQPPYQSQPPDPSLPPVTIDPVQPPPGGFLPRPGPGPIGGGGLSDIPKRQLLMQLLMQRRQAARGNRTPWGPRPPNPYGPGFDYAGYPLPPPGMAGPV